MDGMASYKLHSTTQPALQQMRAHKENYEVELRGMSIIVEPGVWSPAYDWSGQFMIDNLPDFTGKDVLEVGSGSGLISVYAGRSGAKQITSVDINPKAVENTSMNFRKHGIKCGCAFVSDGFSKVRGDFDVVIFNAPYHGCKPADLLEYACADEDYRALRGFFHDVLNHLRQDGVIMLGFSESGDMELFRSLITKYKLEVRRELSEWKHEYNCMVFELSKG